MKALSKLYNYIRCIPKTLLFNFSYLPFKQAIKLPVIVSHRTQFLNRKGSIVVPKNAKTGKIKLGFGQVQVADASYSRFIWSLEKNGSVTFGHNVRIGTGSKLFVSGALSIGDNVNFSGETSITCQKQIDISEGCLVSWRTLFMDTDFHEIINNDGVCLNPDKPIFIGESIWVCANSTILKGVSIGAHSIVSASANVVSSFEGNNIIGGTPAKVIGSMENKTFCM
ncbi:2,3,4,5-tetrahydropyridine-2,6-dicarboxylate N-acetyltransferase [Marinomonas gallaica]|uniref:2,3,4,5-tetrahydropyridine-2,6-dicarboxylate N-acetyltransferase n=1 Tax=Marinomonas gallaica TaxID=1806667 RepID=A0A1C3JNE3_9GAMM|nr:acyltransferase [Marinomonas gallaica]SBT16590.1 2,3,4,5-tetrahydropyridine-2,6-dicarboxylate N-acetyltransferase [Marinomonas gallaica]SBT20306.1 2,3,4,5-tetrahydropyridine-2,6-dicarboxylate N-acetyltransferase [Marinomonas gallaica]